MALTTDQPTVELADIDLLDRDVFAQRVPHEWFATLRRQAPAYHHPEPGGPGFWVFTRHEDVTHLNRDWQTNSSDGQRGGVVQLEELTGEQKQRREDMSAAGQLMLEMDPPDHTRYRKLVNRGFTPKVIRSLEDHLREMSVRIVERAVAGGECDFVVDVAAELPLEAIAEFLGVPFEDRHKIFDWSNRFIGSEDPEYVVSEEQLTEAQVEMFMYANAMGTERKANPTGDIVSNLVNSVIDGDQLSEMDFNLFFLLLSVAGNETTRNAISHGMAAFLEHPDQYRMLVDDPSLMDGAIEEILRWASPVMFFRRNITEDTTYAGADMKAGDKVSLWYISANRDETVFDDPYRFDITRDPNPHIAFGGGGPHFCLGANLARMEMKLLFGQLISQAPGIEQLGQPERLRSNFINGIKHLPIRLSALGLDGGSRSLDFDDSPTEAAFRSEARAWLDAHAPAKGGPDDFSQGYFAIEAADPADRPSLHRAHIERCQAWQRTLLDHRWACITWPTDSGGRGGTAIEATIFAEEQARYGVANDVFAVAIGMVGPTIVAHGTPEQQDRYLTPLLRGEELWRQLFSEPGAGSDLAGVATRAVRDGDEFVVSGQKVWTSDAGTADQGILLARTDPSAPKHRGITYFLVDMSTPGIDIRPLRQMTGGSHFAEVFLDEVRIPAANVLGEVDGGWGVAMTTLLNERVFIGGNVRRFAPADLAQLAREHERIDDHVVRQGLAATHIRSEILTYLGYRVRTAIGRGEAPGPEASCIKLAMAGHLRRSFDLALEIQGAAGAIDGDRWHQQFLNAPSIRIAGGSDEIQRNVIAERALGLPAEPRVDKGVPFDQIPAGTTR